MRPSRWLLQPERGNRRAAFALIWIATRLGRPLALALLYPACLYYFVTAVAARRAIRRFWLRLNPAVGGSVVFRQFLNFATTLLDRIYLMKGALQDYDIRIIGAECVQRALADGRGCILLGSHLGSFEIARAASVLPPDAQLRIVMHEINAQLARELTTFLNPKAAAEVIAAGTPETMLKVKECLDQGGMVGLMGDRVLDEQRAKRCKFLGRAALFPDSPLRLAAALGTPICLFFGIYRGAKAYELYFETFADRIVLNPSNRDAELQTWIERYAQRLEHYCHLAPDNWFNFFEFWCENE